MNIKEHQHLWNSIQAFTLDEPGAILKFSDKLSQQNNWTSTYAAAVIEEYKRFIFLCCISPRGASPSYAVDQVWHLHLTYTQSYWIDFCKNTIQKDIHHHPSKGGEHENHKHEEWYKETLAFYAEVFGEQPPVDIWPIPVAEATVEIPEPKFIFGKSFVLKLIGIMALPFMLSLIIWQKIIPLHLTGPHFLYFYIFLLIAASICYIKIQKNIAYAIATSVKDCLPHNATVFQWAKFLYGKHRALQAGIVDLIRRNLIEVTGDRFIVRTNRYIDSKISENPLITKFLLEQDGAALTYETIELHWYYDKDFLHPKLEAAYRFITKLRRFPGKYIVLVFAGVIGIARLFQGLINDKSVGFLTLLILAGVLAYWIFTKYYTVSNLAIIEIRKWYQQKNESANMYPDYLIPEFVNKGSMSLSGFAEGALLGTIFATAYQPGNKPGTWGSDGSVSSCNSCSGGSSCGGGGSCGGGCGGCGGGD